MNNGYRKFTATFLVLLLTAVTLPAQIATGGPLTLERSVIAGGGTESSGGQFVLNGTIGQGSAGTKGTGSVYSMFNGFWTPDELEPSAAGVSISGCITLTKPGRLIKTTVTLLGGSGTVVASKFADLDGCYFFDSIPAGEFYVVTVQRKGYRFEPDSIAVDLLDSISGLNFTALPQ